MEFKEHDEHLLGCDDIALWLSVFVIFEVVVEKVDGSIEDDEKLSKYHGKSSLPEVTTKAPEKLGDNNAVAFSRDTGRLISKTYHFINGLKKFYAFHINYMCPDAVEELGLVGKDGLLFSHKDGNQECCQVRRKMPLWTALKGLLPWMTELKHHSQSIGVRNQVTGTTCGLLKWNAVAKVENRECGSFLLATIPLFSCISFQGYVSILYEPPIRTALPWQGERDEICWWEDVRPRIVVFSRYGRIIKWPLAVPSIQYGNE